MSEQNKVLPAPGEDELAIESVAKAVYEQWAHLRGYLPWVEGGNSTMQDRARDIARAALAAKPDSAPPAAGEKYD